MQEGVPNQVNVKRCALRRGIKALLLHGELQLQPLHHRAVAVERHLLLTALLDLRLRLLQAGHHWQRIDLPPRHRHHIRDVLAHEEGRVVARDEVHRVGGPRVDVEHVAAAVLALQVQPSVVRVRHQRVDACQHDLHSPWRVMLARHVRGGGCEVMPNEGASLSYNDAA